MALELKTDEDITDVTDAELMPDGDKGTVYKVRHITTDRHREITKQHTTKIPNKRTHLRDDVVDWEAVSDALLDFALAGWEGVTLKGEPVPCVWENKNRLDGPRKAALLQMAGMNEVAAAPERRAQTFPAAPDVR